MFKKRSIALVLIISSINHAFTKSDRSRREKTCFDICADIRIKNNIELQLCKATKDLSPRPSIHKACLTGARLGFNDSCLPLCKGEQPIQEAFQACRRKRYSGLAEIHCQRGYEKSFKSEEILLLEKSKLIEDKQDSVENFPNASEKKTKIWNNTANNKVNDSIQNSKANNANVETVEIPIQETRALENEKDFLKKKPSQPQELSSNKLDSQSDNVNANDANTESFGIPIRETHILEKEKDFLKEKPSQPQELSSNKLDSQPGDMKANEANTKTSEFPIQDNQVIENEKHFLKEKPSQAQELSSSKLDDQQGDALEEMKKTEVIPRKQVQSISTSMNSTKIPSNNNLKSQSLIGNHDESPQVLKTKLKEEMVSDERTMDPRTTIQNQRPSDNDNVSPIAQIELDGNTTNSNIHFENLSQTKSHRSDRTQEF